jgi:hypothetical protein
VRLKVQPSEFVIVGEFTNDTGAEVRLFLEMTCEEVILSPGHAVELLARPRPDLLPLTIGAVVGGLQIHACREGDPDWHIRFKGKIIKPGCPTILSEHE